MLKIAIGFLVVSVVTAKVTFSFESALEGVPEKDRPNFLRYHLNLGYSLENKDRMYSPSPKLSDDESIDLYRYAKEHLLITNADDLKKARAWICFPDGSCIDTGDVGVHPKR
ncbi:hypothetical protein FQR65_LT16213 [Abscondita terminalis]|nr:hypothetical protein FQR65_LT16213 [Abscondita terminalis]